MLENAPGKCMPLGLINDISKFSKPSVLRCTKMGLRSFPALKKEKRKKTASLVHAFIQLHSIIYINTVIGMLSRRMWLTSHWVPGTHPSYSFFLVEDYQNRDQIGHDEELMIPYLQITFQLLQNKGQILRNAIPISAVLTVKTNYALFYVLIPTTLHVTSFCSLLHSSLSHIQPSSFPFVPPPYQVICCLSAFSPLASHSLVSSSFFSSPSSFFIINTFSPFILYILHLQSIPPPCRGPIVQML